MCTYIQIFTSIICHESTCTNNYIFNYNTRLSTQFVDARSAACLVSQGIVYQWETSMQEDSMHVMCRIVRRRASSFLTSVEEFTSN